MRNSALVAVVLAMCWMIVAAAAWGFVLLTVAQPDSSRDCVELCSDWWHPLVTGAFTVVFSASAVANALLATLKLARPVAARSMIATAVIAAFDLLAAVGWASAVAAGARFQVAEFLAGACVAVLGIALFVRLLTLRREPATRG